MIERRSEYVSIVSDVDREEYKIYKSPTNKEIDELRNDGLIIVNAIISEKDVYVFNSNITHEEVMEKLNIKNCIELVINMIKNKVDIWVDEYNDLDQNDKDVIKMLLRFGLPKLSASTVITNEASILIHIPEEDNMTYFYKDLADDPIKEEEKESIPAIQNKPLEWNTKSNPFMSTIDTSPTSNPTFKVPDSLMRAMGKDIKRLKKNAILEGLIDDNENYPVFLNPTKQEIGDMGVPIKFFYFPKTDDLLLAPIPSDDFEDYDYPEHYRISEMYSGTISADDPVYMGTLNSFNGHQINFSPEKNEKFFNRLIEKLQTMGINTDINWY